jgi:hypothetical protein
MNRWALWSFLFLLAAMFFAWETYRAWTAPILLPGKSPGASASLPGLHTASQDNAARASEKEIGTAAILARPVFRPDRRPYQGSEAGGSPLRNYEAELSRLSLIGVILQGEMMKAVVVGISSAPAERWEVGPGDALPGFTVKKIQEDGVLLSADGREFLLPLYAGAPKSQRGGPLRTEVSSAPAPSPARAPGGSPAQPSRQSTTPATAPAIPPQFIPPSPSPRITPPAGSGQAAEILRNRMRRTFKPRTR